MTIHTLLPTRANLHGHFSRDLAPAVTIDPGDTVRFTTLDADWFTRFDTDLANPPADIDGLGERFSPRDPALDDGHALNGPVYIRGAKPGMMLAIHLNRIIPGEWGWVFPWFYTPYEQKHEIPVLLWKLDATTMTGRNQFGHSVALHPFLGVMGMPTDQPGILATKPPRATGGNMDCKELIAGSTLYLPIAVEGGLFSLGDGHAAQGDGESGGTAIECPMTLVDATFELVENPIIPTAYANTPAGWLTFGFNENLQLAHDAALSAMQDFIAARYGVDRRIALGLAGTVVDMHITQTVNDVKGVHAVLPHGALR